MQFRDEVDMSPMVLLVIGCSSPSDEAAKVAVEYKAAKFNVEAYYPLACDEDKAARSQAEEQASIDAMRSFQNGRIVASIVRVDLDEVEKTEFVLSGVTLSEDGMYATVSLSAMLDGTASGHTELNLRRTERGWCVVTGWADQKRVKEAAENVAAVIGESLELFKDWDLDGAQAKVDEARTVLDTIVGVDGGAGGDVLKITFDIEQMEKLITDRRAILIAGRWIGVGEVDPMTDDKNYTAVLESLDGIPNVVGEVEKARILLRCQERKYEVFVSTESMLDADWRYGTVSGRHRFGTAEAEKLRGSRSSDYKAVFLNDPKAWSQMFAEHDGEVWTVELPIYNGGGRAVRFDLTGSALAVEKALGACSR